jgi:hypothetical protein
VHQRLLVHLEQLVRAVHRVRQEHLVHLLHQERQEHQVLQELWVAQVQVA